jgi:Flp pilus assembly protein TadG
MRSKPFSSLKCLKAAESGVAGIEFALVTSVLMLTLLNGVEIARWSFQRMQVRNAVHSASQAVWAACDTKHLPAKTNCTGLDAAITAGLQSTSLGTSVTKTSGYPTEAYYCVNSSGVLTQVGPITAAKPSDCSAVGDASHSPGDYVMLSASYTYKPMFKGITVGNMLPKTLTATGSMRLQ